MTPHGAFLNGISRKRVNEMDYVSALQKKNDVVVSGIKYFVPAQTLDCGQAFRWVGAGENKFKGVAYGRRLEIEMDAGSLILKDTTLAEFDSLWKNYFDLNRSYGHLRRLFNKHETMEKALAFSPGLRLMRQEAWEVLVSFILSQNSNIPRIKKMIDTLCENFGEPLRCGVFAFPTAETLAALSENDLAVIRSGYRAPYIINAAQRVVGGDLNLTELSAKPTNEIRSALLNVHGVGPKVAECVLLFGFGRTECFPMDIWMKRVAAKLYPKGFAQELREYAGIAQQFLFHYARSNPEEFL